MSLIVDSWESEKSNIWPYRTVGEEVGYVFVPIKKT